MHFRAMARISASAAGLLLVAVGSSGRDRAGSEAKDPGAELRAGKNFMATQVYSEEEDREVLELFEGLRVADVTDGMDKAGLQGIGLTRSSSRTPS